jgi:hypothetical protein
MLPAELLVGWLIDKWKIELGKVLWQAGYDSILPMGSQCIRTCVSANNSDGAAFIPDFRLTCPCEKTAGSGRSLEIAFPGCLPGDRPATNL